MKTKKIPLILLLALSSFLSACSSSQNWRTAGRESAGIAPKAADLKAAIFQIYTARAFAWRGYFAVHPWVAWKRKDDPEYTVAQVTAWRRSRGPQTVGVSQDVPDRFWFDSPPTIIFSASGAEAEHIIGQVEKLIEKYPYAGTYTLWPGPNSNTFVDYLIRNVPELTVELPPHAIGKDYLTNSNIVALSPSGKGFQVSLFGALGFTLGLAEGIEVNILSLTFGIDFLSPAIKLPLVGRLGMEDRPL